MCKCCKELTLFRTRSAGVGSWVFCLVSQGSQCDSQLAPSCRVETSVLWGRETCEIVAPPCGIRHETFVASRSSELLLLFVHSHLLNARALCSRLVWASSSVALDCGLLMRYLVGGLAKATVNVFVFFSVKCCLRRVQTSENCTRCCAWLLVFLHFFFVALGACCQENSMQPVWLAKSIYSFARLDHPSSCYFYLAGTHLMKK